jgi:hypothetical protein
MGLDFLGEEEVVIPVGGDFVPTGFIAQWHGAVLVTFMTEMDLKEMEIAFDSSRQMGSSGYTRYYWKNHDAAAEASEKTGQEYAPTSVWVFEAETASVLNFATEEARQVFGPQITYDGCSIRTLRSKKYRHELHMIALPAAVQAYARALGWEVPAMDISALVSRDTAFTDTFQAEMIGDPDAPDKFEESVLWQYRAALWKALGEDNPQAYRSHGSGSKFDAGDNRLSKALNILNKPWTKPAWARLVPVLDPRVGATYTPPDGEPKRLSIPAVMDIYASKEAAQAAADADRERTGSVSTSASTSASDAPATKASKPAAGGKPAVPPDWKGYEEDWKGTVREQMGDVPAAPPLAKKHKAQVLAELREKAEAGTLDIAATVEDVEAWWDHV